MRVINRKQFLENKDKFIHAIKKGKIFVYPTDTIYGIGCNALLGESVEKIREIKARDEKPFSVIAPGKDWIRKNCYINSLVEKWLGKLPGPYTLILELRNWDAVADNVNEGKDSLGVRIPDNWFSKIIEEANVVFVTTSVNLSGGKPIEDIKKISAEMKENIDYVVDEGILNGKASRVVSLVGGKEKVIR